MWMWMKLPDPILEMIARPLSGFARKCADYTSRPSNSRWRTASPASPPSSRSGMALNGSVAGKRKTTKRTSSATHRTNTHHRRGLSRGHNISRPPRLTLPHPPTHTLPAPRSLPTYTTQTRAEDHVPQLPAARRRPQRPAARAHHRRRCRHGQGRGEGGKDRRARSRRGVWRCVMLRPISAPPPLLRPACLLPPYPVVRKR